MADARGSVVRSKVTRFENANRKHQRALRAEAEVERLRDALEVCRRSSNDDHIVQLASDALDVCRAYGGPACGNPQCACAVARSAA